MKPWKKQGWVIPPEANGSFVAAMEQVLGVYKRPYNPRLPVVCMDETPRQLIKETRTPIPSRRGRLERHDYEYERCGVYTVFMASEPLAALLASFVFFLIWFEDSVPSPFRPDA